MSNDIKQINLKKLFRNRISMVYMRAAVIGKLYRKEYKKYVDKFFPILNTYNIYDKIKAFIFCIDIRLYVKVYNFLNKIND